MSFSAVEAFLWLLLTTGSLSLVAEPPVTPPQELTGLDRLFAGVVRTRTLVGLQLTSKGETILQYEYGSGALIQDGWILTAFHNLRGWDTLHERDRDVSILTLNSPDYIPVIVEAVDPDKDIALLRANPRALEGQQPLSLATARPQLSSRAVALGIRAAAAPEHFEAGAINGFFKEIEQRLQEFGGERVQGGGPWLGISQKILPGYSGGPILDNQGALVGILLGAPFENDQWIEFSYGVSLEAFCKFRLTLSLLENAGDWNICPTEPDHPTPDSESDSVVGLLYPTP